MTDNILPFRKKEDCSENTCCRREKYTPLDKATFLQELREITEKIRTNIVVLEELKYYYGENKTRTETETNRFFKRIEQLEDSILPLIILLRHEKRPKEYEKICEEYLEVVRDIRDSSSLIIVGIQIKIRPAHMRARITSAQKDMRTYLSQLSTFMNMLD